MVNTFSFGIFLLSFIVIPMMCCSVFLGIKHLCNKYKVFKRLRVAYKLIVKEALS